MKLKFDKKVKEFRQVLDAGCGCLNCIGGSEKCLMFKQATREEVKTACKKATVVSCIEGPSEEWTERQLNEIAMGVVAKTAKVNAKCTTKSNRVYTKETYTIPLTHNAIAEIAKCNTTAKDYENGGRLDGDLCCCLGNGEFVICPDNVEGDKVYMQCRKCGGYSHL